MGGAKEGEFTAELSARPLLFNKLQYSILTSWGAWGQSADCTLPLRFAGSDGLTYRSIVTLAFA